MEKYTNRDKKSQNTKAERENDYAAAKTSENSFLQHYKKKFGVELEDKSGDKRYQHRDIDFIAETSLGEIAYECKNDTTCFAGKCTGNLFFETTASYTYKNGVKDIRDGWWKLTEADWLVVMYSFDEKEEYGCEMFYVDKLREIFDKNPDKLRNVISYNGCSGFVVNRQWLVNEIKKSDDEDIFDCNYIGLGYAERIEV